MEAKMQPQEEYKRAAGIFEEMARMHRLWTAYSPPAPLKRSDISVLGALYRAEAEWGTGVSAGHLAKMLKQSLPGISQKLRTLEENGYIRRKPAKQDRRVTFVTLTPKGRKTAQQMQARLLGGVEDALENLGENKADELLTLMRELNGVMEQNMPARSHKTGEGVEKT